MSALNGCSSISMKRCSLPDLTASGIVSQANQPLRLAACARSSEVMAKRSWAGRVKPYFVAQSSANDPIKRPFS
jgi:hypothetical protein